MVVLVDLASSDDEQDCGASIGIGGDVTTAVQHAHVHSHVFAAAKPAAAAPARENPNVNGFSAALACYP